MKIDQAKREAAAIAAADGLEMLVVSEESEFENDVIEFGYCPAHAKKNLFPFAEIVERIQGSRR